MSDVDDRAFACRRSPCRRRPGSARPLRSASAWPTSPMRTGGAGVSAARRSSDSARWLPRLLRGERMDLVDDHGARRREHLAARLRAEQHVQRLRRRDDDLRRPAAHAGALALRRVAGANERADLDVGKPERRELGADAGERRLQVALDVVGQRLERRDVDDRRFVGQRRSTPWRTRSSIAARNAASVLPDPVGAATRTWRPALIAGQACDCAVVGPGNVLENHARRPDGSGRSVSLRCGRDPTKMRVINSMFKPSRVRHSVGSVAFSHSGRTWTSAWFRN